MSGFANIIYEKADGVAKITINRPPLNILNVEALREIAAALDDVKGDYGVKVLVITGAGNRAFSAGVDVKDHFPERIEETLECFHRVFHLLAEIDRPIVAVVRGFAFGGGCELACACDMVVASDDAQFGQQEVNVGAIPTVATVLLPRVVGRRRALEMVLIGDAMTAEEARRIGLVNWTFPAAELDEAVNRLINKLKEKSSAVLRLIKASVYQGLDKGFVEALNGVTDIYLNRLMKTEDAVEGLRAFLEKRKPIWRNA